MLVYAMRFYISREKKECRDLYSGFGQELEEGGPGESMICIKRLRYLAQIYIKSNRLAEAKSMQREILHGMELSKVGMEFFGHHNSAEGLGLTLQSVGDLKEAKDILERCLKGLKTILSEDNIQGSTTKVSLNLLRLARVKMLNSNHMKKTKTSEAVAALDRERDHLSHSIRIAPQILYVSAKQE